MRRIQHFGKFTICLTSVVFALIIAGFGQTAQEKVLYNFCSSPDCVDGKQPHGKPVVDKAGNLYGTTMTGGSDCLQSGGCGTVFELSPSASGMWRETVLYSFCVNNVQNCPDGANPVAGLVFDSAGNLYGTTQNGGTYGLGTIFQLIPQSSTWSESVLWSFGATGDGRAPLCDLIFGTSGKLYGTTSGGGAYNGGTVFRLVPHSGGQWSEEILLSFGPGTGNGYGPEAGITFDKAGNLYGTTLRGGSNGLGLGVVYKLSPNPQLPWTETVLFKFSTGTGGNPVSTVSFDLLGNLYGTTSEYGSSNGSIFKLSPRGKEYSLFFLGQPDGSAPYAGLLMNRSGDTAYGTTFAGGMGGEGAIFQVHGTKEVVLYSFCSQPGCLDGATPYASLIARNGILYGTAVGGGANQWGVVYQTSSTQIRSQLSSVRRTRRVAVGSNVHRSR